jgi:hypothetical protein
VEVHEALRDGDGLTRIFSAGDGDGNRPIRSGGALRDAHAEVGTIQRRGGALPEFNDAAERDVRVAVGYNGRIDAYVTEQSVALSAELSHKLGKTSQHVGTHYFGHDFASLAPKFPFVACRQLFVAARQRIAARLSLCPPPPPTTIEIASPQMNKQTRSYAPGSAPDVVARLKQAIEANETTRVLLDQGVENIAAAIKLHLDHQDEHLKRLIADLEGRAND